MDQFEKLIFTLIILFTSGAYILSRIPGLNPPDMYKRKVTIKRFLKLLLISAICLVIFTGFLFAYLVFRIKFQS